MELLGLPCGLIQSRIRSYTIHTAVGLSAVSESDSSSTGVGVPLECMKFRGEELPSSHVSSR